MVTEHRNAPWINNYRSQVERRGVNPDLPSMRRKLLEHHVCYSPSFRARFRHPEELWFMGKTLGYRERERERRKFFWEPRLVQQNWAEHCFQLLPLLRNPWRLERPWTTPAEAILILSIKSTQKVNGYLPAQEDCCHPHPHMFISYICWAM